MSSGTDNRCHCLELARWMLRVVPVDERGVLGAYSDDSWAVCDQHLAEAATGLIERNELVGSDTHILTMRPED